MATIILQTEVQARIDALTYPIEATVLLQNAVDTVGLGLDLTNIIAVLDSSTSAITSGTPEDDVTALNAASLALGVTTKPDAGGGSGGGTLPINGVTPLYTSEDIYSSGGEVWLKSGVLSGDTVTYPDAQTREYGIYTGVQYDLSTEATHPQGVCWDGTHFWVVGVHTDVVFQYTSDGTYTGTSFSVATQDATPTDICWDGTHFWVSGNSSDAVFKYTSAGVYTGTSFSTSAQDLNPHGITWDGTHLWVVGSSNDTAYQYTSTGVYTDVSFYVGEEAAFPQGITWDGTHFWVVGLTNDTVFKYTSAGVYTGISFPSTEDNSPAGLCWKEGYIWTVGTQADMLNEYIVTEAVGLINTVTDTDTGLTIYTRIK